MFEVSQCLNFRSDITNLEKLDNDSIAVCTNMHGVKLFSYDECSVSSNISHEQLNSFANAVSFSKDGKLMAFSVKSIIYVMNLSTKTVLKMIHTDNETVDMLKFDTESKYIFAATLSGRILQYRYDGSSMIGRVHSFKKNIKNDKSPVSSLDLYKSIMACGGSRGALFLINIHSRANKIEIINGNSRINSICFLDDSSIVSGDSEGVLYFNSLKDKKLLKNLQTGFTKITQIALMPNPRYIIVIGDEKHIALYDAKNFKLLHGKYIEFEHKVNKVLIADDHTLLAVLENKSLQKVKLPNSSELKSLILHNSLDNAFKIIQKDLTLKDTQEYKELEDAYDKIYNQAVEAIINQNKNHVIEITNMFKHIDSKREEMVLLTKAFENYPRFKNLYIEKKYHVAYTMAAKLPALQKTYQYKKMEEAWKEVFKNAQRQIAYGRYDNAKALLSEYATVMQKRPLIKLILNHNTDFINFLKAIESKDFQTINEIAKKNEHFTQLPTYKVIEEEINKAIDDIQSDINLSNLDSAMKKIAKLQNIDSIALKITMLKNECRAINKLQNAYEENNFIKCYETLDMHISLNYTELGILLQRQWLKIISKCEEYALKGDIKDIKVTLGELINLSTRRDKTGDLFRVSFYSRIKFLMTKKAYKKAENIIYSYIDIFGLDNEIVYIMRHYEHTSKTKLAITHNQDGRLSRNHWVNSDIIMS